MQKFILFFWLMAGALLSQAQTTIKYDYDANGNLESRHLAKITNPSPALKGDLGRPVAQSNEGSQIISIYPNPTKGIFSIGVMGLESEKENFFMLFDTNGKLLKRERITSDRTSVDITWDGAGMYLLNVSLGGKISRWKIIKQ